MVSIIKTLIINNVASQGYVLYKQIKNSTILSEDMTTWYKGDARFIHKSNNSIGYLLQLYNLVFKYDKIIINFPTTWQHYLIYRLCKLIKKDVQLYFHGSDTRVDNRPKIFQIIFKRLMKDIKRYDDEIWYSTPDLKAYFLEYGDIKCKIKPPQSPVEYSDKKKILIFSRNDSFKKTHLYFDKIREMKDTEFYFFDWFNDEKYKKKFIEDMPTNSKLIKTVNTEHIYFFINGFDDVWGQNSGMEGVSEQEIKKYFKRK